MVFTGIFEALDSLIEFAARTFAGENSSEHRIRLFHPSVLWWLPEVTWTLDYEKATISATVDEPKSMIFASFP